MTKKIAEPTKLPKERALLVGVELHGDDHVLTLEESLAELELLADTAGLSTIGYTSQRLAKPYVQTYIGPGKINEIKALIEETKADIVLFDNELTPRHLRELEQAFGSEVRILDRTALILDIFAQHANTSEGALQVELAQYEYRLPRLTRYWTHLARQAGGGAGRTGSPGGGGLRWPGEGQSDRTGQADRARHRGLACGCCRGLGEQRRADGTGQRRGLEGLVRIERGPHDLAGAAILFAGRRQLQVVLHLPCSRTGRPAAVLEGGAVEQRANLVELRRLQNLADRQSHRARQCPPAGSRKTSRCLPSTRSLPLP